MCDLFAELLAQAQTQCVEADKAFGVALVVNRVLFKRDDIFVVKRERRLASSDDGVALGSVAALAADSQGTLYLGGFFSASAGGAASSLGNIAQYDATNSIQSVGSVNGFNANVRALVIDPTISITAN